MHDGKVTTNPKEEGQFMQSEKEERLKLITEGVIELAAVVQK